MTYVDKVDRLTLRVRRFQYGPPEVLSTEQPGQSVLSTEPRERETAMQCESCHTRTGDPTLFEGDAEVYLCGTCRRELVKAGYTAEVMG